MEAKRNDPEPLGVTSEKPIPVGLAVDVVRPLSDAQAAFNALKTYRTWKAHKGVRKVAECAGGWVAKPPSPGRASGLD